MIHSYWLVTLTTCCSLLVGAQADSSHASPCTQRAGQMERLTLASHQFGSDVRINVYLPPCGDTSGLPVIYLLHGASADETQWPDLKVQSAADALIASSAKPFLVVMPGGIYRPGLDYTRFILSELMPFIERHYGTGIQRVIGGLSLGGYWALRTAFLNPSQFAAVGAHSPIVSLRRTDDPLPMALDARRVQTLSGLPIYLDAGDADPLRTGAADLAQALLIGGVKVSFHTQPGEHNRAYWRLHTPDYLRFYSAALVSNLPQPSSTPMTHRALSRRDTEP